MTVITLSIPGEPVGKARARVTRNGTYTPPKTAAYESTIAWLARVAMNAEGSGKPLDGPLRLKLTAVHGVPASWSKKRTAAVLDACAPHTSKPDLDNIVKAALDGCAGVLFTNDSQITTIVARKHYGTAPRVEIEVRTE